MTSKVTGFEKIIKVSHTQKYQEAASSFVFPTIGKALTFRT